MELTPIGYGVEAAVSSRHILVIDERIEAYKSTMQAAAKLREKLRTERMNLVPQMIETWDEVPLALQLMADPDALHG